MYSIGGVFGQPLGARFAVLISVQWRETDERDRAWMIALSTRCRWNPRVCIRSATTLRPCSTGRFTCIRSPQGQWPPPIPGQVEVHMTTRRDTHLAFLFARVERHSPRREFEFELAFVAPPPPQPRRENGAHIASNHFAFWLPARGAMARTVHPLDGKTSRSVVSDSTPRRAFSIFTCWRTVACSFISPSSAHLSSFRQISCPRMALPPITGSL